MFNKPAALHRFLWTAKSPVSELYLSDSVSESIGVQKLQRLALRVNRKKTKKSYFLSPNGVFLRKPRKIKKFVTFCRGLVFTAINSQNTVY